MRTCKGTSLGVNHAKYARHLFSGRYVINSVRYNSRVLRWLGEVDGDTDVFALQRVVLSSIACDV